VGPIPGNQVGPIGGNRAYEAQFAASGVEYLQVGMATLPLEKAVV
jgi:hypothetical protein